MVVTTVGKSGVALTLVGNTFEPRFCGLGGGSSTATVGDVILGSEFFSGTQRADFTTRDSSTQREVSIIFDFSAGTMSGTFLAEFGTFADSGVNTGSLFLREGFSPITFDGNNELQIQIIYEVF